MTADLTALLDDCEPSPDAGPNVLIRTDAVRALVGALRAMLDLADEADRGEDPFATGVHNGDIRGAITAALAEPQDRSQP